MATGGSDGFVRIWNLSEMITGDLISSNQKLDEDVPPTDIGGEPTFEIQTEGEIVDELDVSKCGSVLSVVLDKKTVFYDTENGHQLLQLDIPQELGKDYKVNKYINLKLRDMFLIFITRNMSIFFCMHLYISLLKYLNLSC